MGEKGLAAMEKLPPDYYIPAQGSTPPGTTGRVKTVAGMAYPTGRPGLPITWDDERGVWRPPGFTPDPDHSDRLFNSHTGQNAVWDEKSQRWVDAKTGEPVSYEQ